MKVLVVFNHPYEKSFCNALLDHVTAGLQQGGHEIDLIHLDRDEFDPVMRAKDLAAFVKAAQEPNKAINLLDPQVINYKQRLQAADHLVFIFPIWWELMPAMTKGFIDKLIFPGIAYDYHPSGKRMINRLHNLKGVSLITTMNTPKIAYRLLFGNAIKKAVLLGTFWKIGIPNRKWISYNYVKFVKPEKRKKWLKEIEVRFSNLKV